MSKVTKFFAKTAQFRYLPFPLLCIRRVDRMARGGEGAHLNPLHPAFASAAVEDKGIMRKGSDVSILRTIILMCLYNRLPEKTNSLVISIQRSLCVVI